MLCAAFRRLVAAPSFAAALQRSREPLPFLISFAHETDTMRPLTWEVITQLCELSALIPALAGAYSTSLCVLPGGPLRVLLKACVINDKTWPAEQRCRLLRTLHASANALQDSAVVNALVEKAEAQRRELKESKVKAGARRQVDAALVRVQMNVWRAAEALMRLGPLGATKAEEMCDESFLTWCLAGERNGIPLLRYTHTQPHLELSLLDFSFVKYPCIHIFFLSMYSGGSLRITGRSSSRALSTGATHPPTPPLCSSVPSATSTTLRTLQRSSLTSSNARSRQCRYLAMTLRSRSAPLTLLLNCCSSCCRRPVQRSLRCAERPCASSLGWGQLSSVRATESAWQRLQRLRSS